MRRDYPEILKETWASHRRGRSVTQFLFVSLCAIAGLISRRRRFQRLTLLARSAHDKATAARSPGRTQRCEFNRSAGKARLTQRIVRRILDVIGRKRLMAASETHRKDGGDSSFEADSDESIRREEQAPVSDSCASHVEAWINEEFGDDDNDNADTSHDEADSYSTLRQVEVYIEEEDFTRFATDSVHDDDADSEDSEDSEESGYETQLWTFP